MLRVKFTIFFIFLLGILLAIAWKYNNEIELAKKHYLLTSSFETLELKETLDKQFSQVYENLRDIELRLQIQNVQLPDNANESLNLILNRVNSDAAEIYREIYLVKFTSGQTAEWRYLDLLHQENSINIKHQDLVFHEKIDMDPPLAQAVNDNLAWLQQYIPFRADNSMPPATSWMTASNNTEFTLAYSIPLYNSDNFLYGIAFAIIDTHSLHNILSLSNSVLMHSAHSLKITPELDGAWLASEEWIDKRQPNPSLLYSDVIALTTSDISGVWLLWSGVENDFFWSRHDVKTTIYFAISGVAAALLLMLSATLILFNKQNLIDKNNELEEQIQNKTAALNKTLRQANNATEEALLHEKKMHNIIDQVTDGIILTDEDGIIELLNDSASKIFDYTEDEVLSMKFSKLVHYNMNPQGDTGTKQKLLGRRKDGSSVYLEVSVSKTLFRKDSEFIFVMRQLKNQS